jgi:hypothetical protein
VLDKRRHKETHCSTKLRPLQRWYGILAIHDEEDVKNTKEVNFSLNLCKKLGGAV